MPNYSANLTAITTPASNNPMNSMWTVEILADGASFKTLGPFPGNLSQADVTVYAQNWINLQKNQDEAAALAAQIAASGPIALTVTG